MMTQHWTHPITLVAGEGAGRQESAIVTQAHRQVLVAGALHEWDRKATRVDAFEGNLEGIARRHLELQKRKKRAENSSISV